MSDFYLVPCQDEDEEEESDALVNQVLDEIGIELNQVRPQYSSICVSYSVQRFPGEALRSAIFYLHFFLIQP